MRRLSQSDAVVIGAGIIGSSTALALSRLGYRVCVIDANRGPGEGTTSYSSGICRMSYSIDSSVRFAWEGYHYWKDWENFIGEKDNRGYARLRECGSAFLKSHNSKSFLDKSVRCMRSAGVRVEEMDFNAAAERLGKIGWDLNHSFNPKRIDDPEFGVPIPGRRIEGAIYCPQSGYVSDPQLATQNICLSAEKKGTTFLFQKRVTEILQRQGRVYGLKLDDGSELHAPIVVNATGPYSKYVNLMAFRNDDPNSVPNDMRVSTRPMRQEVSYVRPPPGVDMDKDGLFTADFDVGIYMRPEVGNKLLIGTIEPACDPLDWFDGDISSQLNTNLTQNWTANVYRAALRIPELPIPSSKRMQGVVSLYDVTEDWTPIYDKSSLGGYYMAIGTSGNQFKNAGVAGELMGAIIDNVENGYKHDSSPLQFEMKRSNPGLFIDTSMFSRLRNINDTSGSVLG